MKKFTLLALCSLLISSSPLLAQTAWNLGGNNVSSSQRLGTNGNYSLIFETNNSDRGRITGGGNWGIGTTDPTAKLHVNSTVSGQIPLRVGVLGSTKFLVHSNGGMAVGSSVTPPANGLYVNGNVGIGTATISADRKLEVVINSPSSTGIYVKAENIGLRAFSSSSFGTGIWGSSSSIGVRGDGDYYGVLGESIKGKGVEGFSLDGQGVAGYSTNGYAGYFESVNNYALQARTTNGYYAGLFWGSIYVNGTYQGSDKNIKKNIQEVNNAMDIINQLRPKNYEFKDDGKYASLHMPKGKHYGLLAQDVEAVLPELVKESVHEVRANKSIAAFEPSTDGKLTIPVPSAEPIESMNIKAVNYTGLIPIMIKAMQEQEAKADKQEQIIQLLHQENTELKERFGKIETSLKTGGNFNLNKPDLIGVSLEQNIPNPASSTTTFRYSIPKEANAQILVYNNAGKLMKSIVAPYAGQVQMESSDLPAGNYIYTLVIDGKQAATKHMTITK